jgi:hypothetical protein
MHDKQEALEELRAMFRNSLAASTVGGSHSRVLRSRGCVDGYMRALLDLGVATRGELLDVITTERERAHGPATSVVEDRDVVDAA